jgi:hypothetical protein
LEGIPSKHPKVPTSYDRAPCHLNVSAEVKLQLEGERIHLFELEPCVTSLVQVCDAGGLFRSVKCLARNFHASDFNLGSSGFVQGLLDLVQDYSSAQSFFEVGLQMAPGYRRSHLQRRIHEFMMNNGGVGEGREWTREWEELYYPG